MESMSWRDQLRPWVPPALLAARRQRHRLAFTDVSGGWQAALQQSTGYDDNSILERVAGATREVLAGRACFERDSVLFYQADFPYPIITALLNAALAGGGRLRVIDFGGSLGSTYRQCAPFLRHLVELHWQVIEQAGFVETGLREFSTDQLTFWPNVQALPAMQIGSFVLASSVLQYLPDPDPILDLLLGQHANHLMIDRTPMADMAGHRLCVQHVPATIYPASYPCWVLSRPQLLSTLAAAGWQVQAELPGIEGPCRTPSGFEFEFRGVIAERTGANP
jgi:putative methyltransferase (TIGR04325 family)